LTRVTDTFVCQTHSYVWHDFVLCVISLIFFFFTDSCDSSLIHACKTTRFDVWHDVGLMCDMTHSLCAMTHLFVWLISTSDMTRSYVWHDWFICVQDDSNVPHLCVLCVFSSVTHVFHSCPFRSWLIYVLCVWSCVTHVFHSCFFSFVTHISLVYVSYVSFVRDSCLSFIYFSFVTHTSLIHVSYVFFRSWLMCLLFMFLFVRDSYISSPCV